MEVLKQIKICFRIYIYHVNLLKSQRYKQNIQTQSLISITTEGSSRMNTQIPCNSMMRRFHLEKQFESTKIISKLRIYIRINMVLAQQATLLSIFFFFFYKHTYSPSSHTKTCTQFNIVTCVG